MEREPILLSQGCGSLNEYRSFLSGIAAESGSYSRVRDMFIRNPSLGIFEISRRCNVSMNEIASYYKSMQLDEKLQSVVNSIFYPRGIMFRMGEALAVDFDTDKEYTEKLLSGQPMCARTVEIHATNGICNYNCVMCLWSDKKKYTYFNQNMESDGLMSLDDWERTLVGIKELGAKTAIFSGGGEVLLNKDFFQLVEFAHKIDLATHLYTNGFDLRNLSDYEWKQILAMDKIRFSIHSPFEEKYSQIVGTSPIIGAFARVTENLATLLDKRAAIDSKTYIGIGFVIQPSNFLQIRNMVDFAQQLGADFLNIRRDEVGVSNSLNNIEQDEIRRQLNIVRAGMIFGDYGSLRINLSDNLTAFANGEDYNLGRVVQCLSQYYRPVVSPYGLWSVCDLKAEPMFYDSEHIIGDLHINDVGEILKKGRKKFIPANCEQCMPSGQTGNAIFAKIIGDYQSGIDFRNQPFFVKSPEFVENNINGLAHSRKG